MDNQFIHMFGDYWYIILPIKSRITTWDDWNLYYFDYTKDEKDEFQHVKKFPCMRKHDIVVGDQTIIVVEKIKP